MFLRNVHHVCEQNDQAQKQGIILLNEIGLEPKEKISGNLKFVPISLELEDGYEHWLGFDNYYSLSRYNRSKLYVMAVFELSQSLSIYL